MSEAATPIRSTFADDPDMRELVEMFVTELSERVAQLEDALDQGDLETLRVIAHQLKGAGGGYGFTIITEVAREAEAAVRQAADLERIQQAVGDLVSVCRRVEV